MNRMRIQKLTAIGMAVIFTALIPGLIPEHFPAAQGTGTVYGQDAGEVSSPKDSFHTNTPNSEPETKGTFPLDTPEPDDHGVRQLTEDDIAQMNDGRYGILYSDQGYITFLQGRYYDGKVENFEDGIKSLWGMASLLGLSRGSEFYAVYAMKNAKGYTYYTYQQRYGDLTLENAVLKVIVDPEGNAVGLVSSFVPNVGIAPKEESSITAEEALEVVRGRYPGEELRFYPEETRQTSTVAPDGVAMHCWAVFTNLPRQFSEVEGPAYMEHIVSYEGEYLFYISVSSPQEMVYGEDVQVENALKWFDGLEADTYTGVVTKHDGTQKEVTVPVAYDPEAGVYYLADPERHILLTDYLTYASSFSYKPFTSKDNTGWPDVWLLTYDSYIKVYDFYQETGLWSTDGFGRPILIMTDWVEDTAPHNPVRNAAFMGYINGWALFAASTAGYYGECLDVIGHEFTHAVTEYSMAGWKYLNEPGALNEALSDVMGNLIEMMLGETEDTQWLIAEHSDITLRNMSYPWQYNQPITIGGEYYLSPVMKPSDRNDNGGVHTNSSLINIIAWKLHAAGMDPMEEFLLFREAGNLLTPDSGFQEMQAALIFAVVVLDMEKTWVGRIMMYCEEAGY